MGQTGSGLTASPEISVLTEDFGAGSRTRTDDLLITNQLLYQLSYAGKAWTGERSILARAPGLPRRSSRAKAGDFPSDLREIPRSSGCRRPNPLIPRAIP